MSIDSSPGPVGPPRSSEPAPSRLQDDTSTVRSRTAWTARRRLHTPDSAESPERRVPVRQKRMAAADPDVMAAAKRARVVGSSDDVHEQKDEKKTQSGVPVDVWSFFDAKGETRVVSTPGAEEGMRTIVLRVGDSYHKFHGIRSIREGDVAAPLDFREWVRFGQGYLNKTDLEGAIEAIPNESLQRAIRSALEQTVYVSDHLRGEEIFLREDVARAIHSASSPKDALRAVEDDRSEVVYANVMERIRAGKLKISTVKGWKRHHTIIPVIKRRLGSGTTKNVGVAFPLSAEALSERVMAVAKLTKEEGESPASKAEKVVSLKKEVWLSEIFRHHGIPHVLNVHEIGRGDGEVGIMMPFCGLGDLFDLSRRIDREAPSDGIRRERVLRLGIQVGESLEALHSHGYVHGDVKTANVFVKGSFDLDPEIEACLSDYDCVNSSGATSSVAGTFPPPEALREIHRGNRIELKPAVDAWAYGVLLYELYSGKKSGVAQLSFDNGLEKVVEGRKKALAELPPHDPISDVIRGLLFESPGRRMTVADAVARLRTLETEKK